MKGATNIALTALACALIALLVSCIALYAVSVRSEQRMKSDKELSAAINRLAGALGAK